MKSVRGDVDRNATSSDGKAIGERIAEREEPCRGSDRRRRLLSELSNLSCLRAEAAKFFFRRPATFIAESAPNAKKWIKRTHPWLYYHLSLHPFQLFAEHLAADAFLVSFPKCGRTWLRAIIARALSHSCGVDYDRLMHGTTLSCGRAASLRLVVVHDDDPFWKAPEELNRSKTEYRYKKVVFLVREPKDVLVSSYFEKTERKNAYAGSLSDYLDEKVGGLETLLEYYDIWNRNSEVPRGFLLVRYEDLRESPGDSLCKVLDFLGCSVSKEVIRDAVEYTSFHQMQQREIRERAGQATVGSTEEPPNVDSLKTRRGKVGGWCEYLSPEQVELLDERMRSKQGALYPV